MMELLAQVAALQPQQATALVASLRKFLSHGWPPAVTPVAAAPWSRGEGGALTAERQQQQPPALQLPRDTARAVGVAASQERPARYRPPQQRERSGEPAHASSSVTCDVGSRVPVLTHRGSTR